MPGGQRIPVVFRLFLEPVGEDGVITKYFVACQALPRLNSGRNVMSTWVPRLRSEGGRRDAHDVSLVMEGEPFVSAEERNVAALLFWSDGFIEINRLT